MRILIPNLSPGTVYSIQLRAKDASGHTSEWSRVFSLTTTSDTVAPKTPTNVANTVSGTAFKFTWDAVTLSADNSPAHDLNGYLVRVSTPANGITRIYQTTDTKMDFSFENNVAVFGTPQGTVRVEVAAIDNIGNASPYSAMVSASNPAPAAVTGLTATPGTDSINIKWTANTTDNDLKGYEVWLSTTGAAGTYSKVYSGLANSYVHPTVLYAVDHYFRVYSVDVFGTQSTAVTSSAVRPNSAFAVDNTPPGVPTGLAATLTNSADGKTATAAISWTAVTDTDNDLSEYIIGYKPSSASDWQYAKVDYTQTSTTINGLLPFTNYDFRIRSSDWSANLSAWSAVVTKTAVANAAPSVPTGLAITPGRDSVIVRWTANTEPDMANGAGVYDVTLSTSSTFASGNLQYRTGADNITITGLNTTTTYYARVRATDSGGLSSAYSSSVNATTGTIPSTPGDIGAASQVDLNAARLAAYKSSGLSANPNFSEWAGGAGSVPDSWVLYGGTPIKETTNVRTAPYAFRQTITSAVATGIYGASSGNLADLPLGLEYVTVEVDVKLISGNFSASGVLLDWTGMTPPAPRAYMSFNDAVPNPVLNQWYRITRVLRRPTNLVGTQTSWTSYLMTNYQAGTTNWGLYTNKDIIFDRVQYRPSTQEEIESYGTNGQPAISVLGSRGGTDLVTNGSGILGNNTNFSAFTFDKVDTPVGTTGSFNTPANTQSFLDEFMPVDPARRYLMRFQAKQKGTAGAYAYAYLSPYDAFGNIVSPQFYMFQNNTTTTLAVDLKPGDTTITLTSAANWNNAAGTATHNRSLIAWGFTDAGGKVWGERTYSRDWRSDLWADGGISGNVITLKTPWVGFTNATESGRTTIPAGTVVSNGSSGGNYMYGGLVNTVVPSDWTTYQAEFGGIMPNGPSQTSMTAATTSFPPGTSTVKMGFLQNRQSSGAFATGSAHSFAAVSFSDATQAQYLTESWRSPNTTTINGGVITTGTVDAIVMKANSAFVTTLNIGSGGGIQSTGYTAGGTSGFRLDTSGLVIKGTGNQIDVNAIVTSSLTSTTITLGASGVISVGVGGTISIDGSTGQLKSNNYAANSTGYRLSNAGLEVNDGSIDAKVLKTGSAIIGDLTIGRSADALGTIKSFDYVAGSAGWKIGKGLFEINQGTVKAAALQIQAGSNLMPAEHASFEYTPAFYNSGKILGTGIIWGINSGAAKFGTGFLGTIWGTSTQNPTVRLASSATDYNVQIDNTKSYILSAYVRTTGTVTTVVNMKVKYSNATEATIATITPTQGSTTWVRVSGSFTPPAGTTALHVFFDSTTWTANGGFDVDGVQLEEKVGALTTPSSWNMPGTTTADGGMIRTGAIASSSTVSVNGSSMPAWSINLSGNAQFGDGLVRGKMLVGIAGDPDLAQSYISSGNFVSGSAGWKLDSSGNIEANNGTFRGTITGSSIYGSTLATSSNTNANRVVLNSTTGLEVWQGQVINMIENPRMQGSTSTTSQPGYSPLNATFSVINNPLGAGYNPVKWLKVIPTTPTATTARARYTVPALALQAGKRYFLQFLLAFHTPTATAGAYYPYGINIKRDDIRIIEGTTNRVLAVGDSYGWGGTGVSADDYKYDGKDRAAAPIYTEPYLGDDDTGGYYPLQYQFDIPSDWNGQPVTIELPGNGYKRQTDGTYLLDSAARLAYSNIMLEQAQVGSDYFDGSYGAPYGAWAGAADASRSLRDGQRRSLIPISPNDTFSLLDIDSLSFKRDTANKSFTIGAYDRMSIQASGNQAGIEMLSFNGDVTMRNQFATVGLYDHGDGTGSTYLYHQDPSGTKRSQVRLDETSANILVGDSTTTNSLDMNKYGMSSYSMQVSDSGDMGTLVSTTLTTFQTYSGGPYVVFTAPKSGIVTVLGNLMLKSSVAGSYTEVSAFIRTGSTPMSGTNVANQFMASCSEVQWHRAAAFAVFTGLTPGATYNVYLGYRNATTGNTGSVSTSRLAVLPSF